MKIESRGGMEFVVTSGDSGEEYIVQVATNRPHGWCSCPDYEFRQSPQHAKTSVINRCKHIQAVAEHLFQRVVDEFVEARKAEVAQNVAQAQKNRRPIPSHSAPTSGRTYEMREVPSSPINRPAPRYPPKRRPFPRA